MVHCRFSFPVFSFTGNTASVAGFDVNTFCGKSGLKPFTQTETVTSLWELP